MRVEVIGSGIVGLCVGLALAERGCPVRLYAKSAGADAGCCSWYAGGMLAPCCEMESAEPLIGRLAAESKDFWRQLQPNPLVERGSLVLAHARDTVELERFARKTGGWRRLDCAQVQHLEPELGARFAHGLYYPSEAHLDPRTVLPQLTQALRKHGVDLQFGREIVGNQPDASVAWRIDCRGLAAQDALADLRGVKGEMILLQTDEIRLSRPVRLLHPRIPLYVVPRAANVYMIGATVIESEEPDRASARSVLELLSAAYAVHPAFGEARVLEIGVGVRPAFADNLPHIRRRGRTIYVNGMYRHGFLTAPALAQRTANFALDGLVCNEVIDENYAQWPIPRNGSTHPVGVA